MRRPLALGLALGSLALISAAGASSRLGTHPALAAQTWNVQAGADIAGGIVSGNWYFPNVVTVNVGDTVSWTFPSAEPHGVSFDNGHTPTVFEMGFAPLPNGEIDVGAPNFPFPPGPNPPTVFDPTQQINLPVSQDPPDQRKPMTLTFNTAGVFSYDCPIHGPAMPGTIIVQAAGSTLSETPDKEKARGQADLVAATAAATAAASAGGPPIPQPGPVALSNGSTLYPVTAGVQITNGVSALQFLGGNITVHQGDTVTFTVADPSEIHTVTFTSGAPPPDLVDVRPQPAGPPQIVFPAMVAQPQGGNSYDGTGFLNSGILFPGSTFTLTINAPPGTYQYRCLLHGGAPQNMTATITVQ